jgi:3-phosphoshikimate 1-carboxyvinyltransferase
MDASISSQFISSLLLIGPYLPGGLQIQCVGNIVSKPYIELTLKLMQSFGVEAYWDKNKLIVPQGDYRYENTRPFQIETDWTSASYFWLHGMALGIQDLRFPGLQSEPMQGDSILSKWTQLQGMASSFQSSGWNIQRTEETKPFFGSVFDGKAYPDLALTHISLYSFFGLPLRYKGLSTLFSKESHRSEAMRQEWRKVGVEVNWDQKGNVWTDGLESFTEGETLMIDSHEDHRIAMCLSVLAAKSKIWIRNPHVVHKSFPNFWSELVKLGYEIEFEWGAS